MWHQKLGGKLPSQLSEKVFRFTLGLLTGTAILFLFSWLFGATLHMRYSFFWNIFLSFLPMLFSLLLSHRIYGGKKGILNYALGVLWLIFYPNAPYMVTDLIHISTYDYPYGQATSPNPTAWLGFAHITASVLIGCAMGCLSLYLIHSLVRRRIGSIWAWFFCGFISLLSGIGIFVGRFMRFNSWDLLRRPLELLQQLTLRPKGQVAGFCLLFASMTFGMYFLFYLAFHIPQNT